MTSWYDWASGGFSNVIGLGAKAYRRKLRRFQHINGMVTAEVCINGQNYWVEWCPDEHIWVPRGVTNGTQDDTTEPLS